MAGGAIGKYIRQHMKEAHGKHFMGFSVFVFTF